MSVLKMGSRLAKKIGKKKYAALRRQNKTAGLSKEVQKNITKKKIKAKKKGGIGLKEYRNRYQVSDDIMAQRNEYVDYMVKRHGWSFGEAMDAAIEKYPGKKKGYLYKGGQ